MPTVALLLYPKPSARTLSSETQDFEETKALNPKPPQDFEETKTLNLPPPPPPKILRRQMEIGQSPWMWMVVAWSTVPLGLHELSSKLLEGGYIGDYIGLRVWGLGFGV